MLLLQLDQPGAVKFRFAPDQFQFRPAQPKKLLIIFILALFTEKKERLASYLKIRLCQRIRDKFGLAALQKTVDHIDRFHIVSAPFLLFMLNPCRAAGSVHFLSVEKSAASLSSCSLEPITQNLPVTSGFPLLILLSSGT